LTGKPLMREMHDKHREELEKILIKCKICFGRRVITSYYLPFRLVLILHTTVVF